MRTLLFALTFVSAAGAAELQNPILFVTQVPPTQTFSAPTEVFFTQDASPLAATRGGDLWILYHDGTRRNLTAAAGYGVAAGHQQSVGDPKSPGYPEATDPKGSSGGIAVRNPSVHWLGNKAVFSMVVGSAPRYQVASYRWQLYEIRGFGQNETPVITKVPNQPPYNNVQPVYLSDGRILFASDRPRGGIAHHYPQLDEYESSPTLTGLYALDSASGELQVFSHSVSGDFTPQVASDGRVVFTRWDHLLRDQQADAQLFGDREFGAFTFADESEDAARVPISLANHGEVFPEPREKEYTAVLYPGQPWDDLVFNSFVPWQINQDGSGIETLNHIGRHELVGSFESSRTDDPGLEYFSFANPPRHNQSTYYLLLQLRQSPVKPDRFYAVHATEFGARAAGQIVALDGLAPGMDPALAEGIDITHDDTWAFNGDDEPPRAHDSGKYRNVLPLADGSLIAAHTAETRTDVSTSNATTSVFDGQTVPTHHPSTRYRFRLRRLVAQDGLHAAGGDFLTGAPITKTVSYFNPDVLVKFDDVELWELDPVEVVARPVPPITAATTLPAPEAQAFAQAGVDETAFRAWLRERGLGVVSVRNATTRDAADLQQPYNLRVPGGVQTLSAARPDAKIYEVSHLQLFQADLLRGYGGVDQPYPGRRPLARPLHDAENPHAGGPESAVKLGLDGSAAAFVPAQRALAWQLVSPEGEPIVRERVWTSTQPGEIRVCTSCHGINGTDQAGAPPPQNTPQALIDLLDWWKSARDELFADGFES